MEEIINAEGMSNFIHDIIDEEFVKEESFFDGKTIGLIGINLLCIFLNIITF